MFSAEAYLLQEKPSLFSTTHRTSSTSLDRSHKSWQEPNDTGKLWGQPSLARKIRVLRDLQNFSSCRQPAVVDSYYCGRQMARTYQRDVLSEREVQVVQCIPFYRLTVLSNLSEAMVPDVGNSWSVMAEVAEPHSTQLAQDDVVRSVIAAGESLHFLERSDLLSVWHHRLPFGYPVPTLDQDAILDEINSHLEFVDIYSRGRFGAWNYEVSNQDHSFMQGVECVDRLLYGHVEPTLDPRVSDILLSG